MNDETNPYRSQPLVESQAAGHPATIPSATASDKVPTSAHFLCGWPFLMILIGGAIGGGLGGGAYAINMAIYKSTMPVPVKIVLNLFVGFAAFAIWCAIVIAIQMARSE